MNFELHLIGCSFKQTRLENVSRVQWPEPSQITSFLKEIRSRFPVQEVFYLQTCNRREFYMYAPSVETEAPFFFTDFLKTLGSSLGCELVRNDFYHLRNATAVRHFFCVASSLDSMVLGETEIIKQIKDQTQLSSKHGHMEGRLKAMVDLALGVSKQVRHQTKITQKVTSLGSLAFRYTKDHLRAKPKKRVVFVGAGHFIRSILPTFAKSPDLDILVVNRTLPTELAQEYACEAMTLEAFLQQPPAFEVMITATGAPHALFDGSWLAKHATETLILDAALPQDVAFNAEDQTNIQYLDLDSLEKVLSENRAAREAEIPLAEPFFREGLRRLRNKWLEFSLSCYSQEISQHYQHTGERALKHLLKEVGPQLNEEHEQALRDWTQALMGRLTSIPILGLKGVARELGSDAVEAYTRSISAQSNLFKS